MNAFAGYKAGQGYGAYSNKNNNIKEKMPSCYDAEWYKKEKKGWISPTVAKVLIHECYYTLSPNYKFKDGQKGEQDGFIYRWTINMEDLADNCVFTVYFNGARFDMNGNLMSNGDDGLLNLFELLRLKNIDVKSQCFDNVDFNGKTRTYLPLLTGQTSQAVIYTHNSKANGQYTNFYNYAVFLSDDGHTTQELMEHIQETVAKNEALKRGKEYEDKADQKANSNAFNSFSGNAFGQQTQTVQPFAQDSISEDEIPF